MLATSKKLVIGVTITDLQMLHKIYVQFYSIVEVVVEDDCDSSNNSLYKTFSQGINSKKLESPDHTIWELSCKIVFHVLK